MKKEELLRKVLCEYTKHTDCTDESTGLTDPGHANAVDVAVRHRERVGNFKNVNI